MRKIMLCSCFILMFLISSGVMAGSASAAISVPTSNLILPPYAGLTAPVLNDNPMIAKPVAVGPVAVGGNVLTLQVGLNQFSGPVDIYGAFIVNTNPTIVNVLKPGATGFTSFTLNQILAAISLGIPPAGTIPWMTNVTGPISQTLFNTAISNVPSGAYSVYLLVTPTGTFNDFYLWWTFFTSP